MTRAVIKLSGDISEAMPFMEKMIEGCAYNSQVPIASFRYKDMRIIVNKDEITIKDIVNEASVLDVFSFLKSIIGAKYGKKVVKIKDEPA